MGALGSTREEVPVQHKEQWQAAFGDVMLLAVESQAVGIGGVDDLERALKWLMLLPQLLILELSS